MVLESSSVKTAFAELMQEILEKRIIATRKNLPLQKLRPFSKTVYNELFDSSKVYSILGSIIQIALQELRDLGALKLAGNERTTGKYWAAPADKIRKQSYEELANAKNLPKTKLGKLAWSIVREIGTGKPVVESLQNKKEQLLNELIEDLTKLTQDEIDKKFSLLKEIIQIPKDQILQIIDNLILHNLASIPLKRKTFNDSKELVQQNFRDIMVNIRLSHRSQTRQIRNLQQEEGTKVWSKTVTWAHAFEQDAQDHALEKETITTKAGRNSLILDFGKYEEGKRKGNSVTEGIAKLKQELKINDQTVAYLVLQILWGKPQGNLRNLANDPIYPSEAQSSILTNIAGLFILEFKRNPNFTSFMVLDLIRAGKITWEDALDQPTVDGGMLPMSMSEAMKAARCLHDLYSPYMPHVYQIQGEEKFDITDLPVLDLITREQKIYSKWNKLYAEIQQNKLLSKQGKQKAKEAKKALRITGKLTIQDQLDSIQPRSIVHLPR